MSNVDKVFIDKSNDQDPKPVVPVDPVKKRDDNPDVYIVVGKKPANKKNRVVKRLDSFRSEDIDKNIDVAINIYRQTMQLCSCMSSCFFAFKKKMSCICCKNKVSIV